MDKHPRCNHIYPLWIVPKQMNSSRTQRIQIIILFFIITVQINFITTSYHRRRHYHRFRSKGNEAGLITYPISTMDSFLLVTSASPTAAAPPSGAAVLLVKKEKEEESAIAEKGFYRLPAPRSNSWEPPKLLLLFPVHSPKRSSVSSTK